MSTVTAENTTRSVNVTQVSCSEVYFALQRMLFTDNYRENPFVFTVEIDPDLDRYMDANHVSGSKGCCEVYLEGITITDEGEATLNVRFYTDDNSNWLNGEVRIPDFDYHRNSVPCRFTYDLKPLYDFHGPW